MRILLVSSLYAPDPVGGAEVVVADLARWLTGGGADVTVLALTPGPGVRYGRVDGIKVLRLPLRNIYWSFPKRPRNPLAKGAWHLLDRLNLLMYLAARKVFRRLRPDLVHTHQVSGFSPFIWLAAKQAGIPLVHTLHDFSGVCLKSSRYRERECMKPCLPCRLGTLPNRWAAPSVDVFTGVSAFLPAVHRDWGMFGPEARVETIPNACVQVEASARSRPRAAGQDLRFGFLGRLVPEKGIGWLVRLLALRGPVPGWRLRVGGRFSDPAFEQEVRRLACPRVEFLGQVDPRVYFQALDVLVVPSLWSEPFGLVATEAMAHGVPVLAAARGGLQEIIEHGRNGFLFEPDDPATLLMLFDRLLAGDIALERLRENALATAARHAEALIYPRYLKVYDSLLRC